MRDARVIQETRVRVLQQYPILPPVGLSEESRKTGVERDDVLLLTSIYQKPFVTGTTRAVLLNMSVPTVSRLHAALQARNWIVPHNFSRPARGYVKYYNINDQGLAAAQLRLPDEGSGSCMHRQCQIYLCDLFRTEGFSPQIEFMLNSKRADIAFNAKDKWTAVEVGISSAENEVSNIRKDLAAGFSEVRVLVRESSMIARIKTLMEEARFKLPASVKLELLTEYLDRSCVAPPDDSRQSRSE